MRHARYTRPALATFIVMLALAIVSVVSAGDRASGFNRTLPVYPQGVNGPRQIQERLTRMISWLRERTPRTISAADRTARAQALARLEEYRVAGFFPLNEQHPNEWAPAFIDSRGAICAVGYLIEQSEGRAVAERINARFHDATIEQIDDPALDAWISRSGLTRDEVIAIQEPGWNRGVDQFDGALRSRIVIDVPDTASAPRAIDTVSMGTIATLEVMPADSSAADDVRRQ
jgi:hypothetical protein